MSARRTILINIKASKLTSVVVLCNRNLYYRGYLEFNKKGLLQSPNSAYEVLVVNS